MKTKHSSKKSKSKTKSYTKKTNIIVSKTSVLTLKDYNADIKYKNLRNIKNIAIVDNHIHFRGYGHKSLEYNTIINFLIKSGVLFATITGIGQRLPNKSNCNYYGMCPNEKITPSVVNDIINMENYFKYYNKYKNKIHLILSFTSIDLHKPIQSYNLLNHYITKYKGHFKACGEINLCKQALFSNGRNALPIEKIKDNRKIMNLLLKNDIPILIHSDLGNNDNNTQYLKLIKTFVKTYKDNIILWAHFGGLCKELTNIDNNYHIEIIEKMLKKYPKLYIDVSWDIVLNIINTGALKLKEYVNLINKYSTRFIIGSDFIGSKNKKYKDYKNDISSLKIIKKHLTDTAYINLFLGRNYINLYKLNYKVPI